MRARGVERLLWVLLALACVLHLVSWTNAERRNFEFLPDMVVAVPYESQSPNPNFPDGKTQQRPPEGTIARGYPPLRSGDLLLDLATPWDELSPAQREAWNGLAPPWPATASEDVDPETERARLRRGEKVFLAFCAACHGAGGAGDGPVTLRGVPPPPSLLADNARDLTDGQLFRIVTAGRGNMPSYAAQVEREDRWKALHYVRALQSR